jgi:hypothetical protein
VFNQRAEEATEHRKTSMAELIAFEDEHGKRQRESELDRQQTIAAALKQETSAFYCEICDKQYVKITEWENHLSSYDHHHKKRFMEMRAEEKARNRARAKPKKERVDPAMAAAAAAAAAAGAAAGAEAGAAAGAAAMPGGPPTPTTDATSVAGGPPAEALSAAIKQQPPAKMGGFSLGGKKKGATALKPAAFSQMGED